MLETIENVLLEGGADPVLERSELKERTREEFDRLMESHRKTVSERDQSERARRELELQVRALKKDLHEQNAKLQREIDRIAPQVRFSEDSLATMETRLRGVLDETLRDVRREGMPADKAGLSKVERSLQDVVDQTMQEERDKAQAQAAEVRDLEVERLQHRIAKLNAALDTTESTLRNVAAAKEIDPGVASVYRGVQGPPGDDADGGRKQEMIKVVFVNNLLLRDKEVRPDDLEGIPPEYLISSGRFEAESPPESSRFAAPVEPVTDETAF